MFTTRYYNTGNILLRSAYSHIHLNIRLAILATTGRFFGFFLRAAPLPLSSLSRLLLDLPKSDGGSLVFTKHHSVYICNTICGILIGQCQSVVH